ncbi:hypothetical protein HN51_013137 [Arachis hypogaea]|uniref:glycosyl hydrolase 5 family protein n=1 Tax=Arachis hypogaea TaxID=3818 RepID=UPI000DECEBE6|nr:glycosyl hydrolase 5 family protein [Arachis hypogaea]QHO58791.1 Endoglucanase [Arachis hypogaea]
MKMLCKVSVLLLFLATLTCYCNALPLSTHKRWIIDDATGKRVKLTCAHWVAHAKPMVAEGLDQLPLNDIVKQFPERGFNCVRLSYATYMFTRYANVSIGETLRSLDIPERVAAIEKHNPWVLNMTHLQAYDAVVDALDKQGVMMLIDNHVSMPKWCCDRQDQNGFFNDRHFQPQEWLQGLAFVARHFKPKRHVVAMDLRNELRGSRESSKDWYKYVRQGARTIDQHNPNLLVVISGLDFDKDFTFLKNKPLDLNFTKKIVYEAHLYSFTGDTGSWSLQPVNRVCASVLESVQNLWGFLIGGSNPAPMFVSEFGYDMTGENDADNKYIVCFKSYLAAMDMDWSLWSFGGSYYYRQGNVGADESYAVLTHDWTRYRDPKFPHKFQLLQALLQDPTSNLSKSQILFHPLSGNCTHVSRKKELEFGDCKNHVRWSFEGDNNGAPIRKMDSPLCLKATGEGLPPTLSKDCLSPQSSWRFVSVTGLHLATKNKNGDLLCLGTHSHSSKLVTKKCICVDDDDSACLDNPQSQWFQLLTTNV